MKIHNKVSIAVIFVLLLTGQAVMAQEEDKNTNQVESIITDIASFIGNTITGIVTGVTDLARDVVSESIGINNLERGYGRKREHEPLPECASDEARRELAIIHEDYSEEITQFEEELGQEVAMEEAEFEKNVADGDSRRKVNAEKRALEKKLDEAYARFDEKVIALNAKYDAKRDNIISKERESEGCA